MVCKFYQFTATMQTIPGNSWTAPNDVVLGVDAKKFRRNHFVELCKAAMCCIRTILVNRKTAAAIETGGLRART